MKARLLADSHATHRHVGLVSPAPDSPAADGELLTEALLVCGVEEEAWVLHLSIQLILDLQLCGRDDL